MKNFISGINRPSRMKNTLLMLFVGMIIMGTTALAVELEKCSIIFDDVDISEQYCEDIVWGVEEGIFMGTSLSTFSPNDTITRASFIALLYRYNKSESTYSSNFFNDVSNEAYYHDAVAWAAELGIIKGVGSNSFGPDLMISREDIAVILYRFFNANGYQQAAGSGGYVFSDINSIDEYAKDAVRWAQTTGIYVMQSNLLEPHKLVSRAEAAAILHRFNTNFEVGI